MWEKHLDYISSFPFSFIPLLLLFLLCRFHHPLPLILPFDMLVKFFLLRIHRQYRREKCAICGSMVHMTRVKSSFINHGANDLTLSLSPSLFFYLTIELSSLSSSLTNLSEVLIKVKYTAHHTKLFFHYREDTTKQPQKKTMHKVVISAQSNESIRMWQSSLYLSFTHADTIPFFPPSQFP
jgi:hypothetical protein